MLHIPCFLLMQGLTNLETFRLYSRHDMRFIWKGLVLSKLTTLEVFKCKRLTHVFTCSMIVSLIQLEVLKILSCEELEHIIAKNDDENDQILLGDHLQSLCFPNLCQIEIRECNKLKSLFPVAMASGLPKLQTLRVSEASQLLGVCGQDDHTSPVNVEKEMVLPNLCEIEIRECNKLKSIFPVAMIVSLVQLKVLKILSCEELEQIIARDNDDEKDQILPGDHLQSLCFPNLCEIEIRECNKLKSLYPVAMASGLPKLQTLRISEASQLLGVFGQDDHASFINVEKEMVLPNLITLSLEQLSNIVCFSFGSCDFLFPNLRMLKVHQCPKLTTKFATTPDGSMSAQSEVLLI